MESSPAWPSSASKLRSRASAESEEPVSRKLSRLQVEEHIQLLRSLDERLREDLAQHLLMTYHLNQSYKQPGKSSPVDSNNEEQPTESETEDGQQGGTEPVKATSLLRRWRAWPLPLLQVPQIEPGYTFPDSLHDSIFAAMLRHAAAQKRPTEGKMTFSADDEMSGRLCAPAVEHIAASLDRLFASLYRSREGYSADESLQNTDALLRKGRKRRQRGDQEGGGPPDALHAGDGSIKKRRTDAAGSSLRQVYKQGSQQLLSASDVLQHAAIQSFPRGVLERAGKRLESLLQLPENGGLTNFLTLFETKERSTGSRSLEKEDQNHVDAMKPLDSVFLKTDTDRLELGGKRYHRTMWEIWDDRRVQIAEAGCFDRDRFLEEIPAPGTTNENRRRRQREKKYQELEVPPA